MSVVERHATSLTGFKRLLKPGTRLRVVDHYYPNQIGEVREVTRLQTNGYWYAKADGQRGFWAGYPPPSNFHAREGLYVFWWNPKDTWVLEIIEEASND